jgi:ferrous iron transport protein B
VGNWPGVTVEVKHGLARHKGCEFEITDLPGTYSLSAQSTEELIARDYILDHKPDVIIQVVEGPNIERNLYLTTQLIDFEVPVVIALNMYDEVRARNIKINIRKLSNLLGIPIVPTIGKYGKGMRRLLDNVIRTVEGGASEQQPVRVSYGHEVEDHIEELEKTINLTGDLKKFYPPRWLALGLIEGDEYIASRIHDATTLHDKLFLDVMNIREHLSEIFKNDPEEYITERRYGFIKGALKESLILPDSDETTLTERLDSILTNRILGLPILFFLMWLLFQVTFDLGSYPMDWIDAGVGHIGSYLGEILPEGAVKNLIIDGVIGGVGSVIIFLPNILILFLGISFLEDTGYMARAAFVTDRVMHALGLHGKSFIPLLMGFGCAVPAVMATRMLDTRRDRIITMLVVPLMSCSAKLPVYILITGIFFPNNAGNVIFLLYIIGILMSLVAARVLGSTLFKGESSPFVMELPTYRWPTAKSVLIHMWFRAQLFLRKMGGVILIGSIVLWFLGAYPQLKDEPSEIIQLKTELQSEYSIKMASAVDDQEKAILRQEFTSDSLEIINIYNSMQLEHTFIGRIGHFIAPVMKPLGFSWQMGVALLTGFVAKEVVVSSMGVLYSAGEDGGADLSKALTSSGVTPLSGFAFLLFTLLYTPCIATVVAIHKESGSSRWTAVSIFYQFLLAWLMAFIVYQGGIIIGI